MTLTNLLRHISIRHVRYQKARTLIAVCGIALGVASMVSIDTVNKSVLRSFEDSINRLTGRAVLQITGAESGFPEEMLDRVQKVPGVEYAVPVIETNASFSGGTERALLILGVDALQDNKIRSYSLSDDSADIPDPLLFLAKPDSILLTREMAAREGFTMDQHVRLQTVQGIKTFTVRGLLDPDGPAKAAGGELAIMDIYAAQMAFGKEGRIDRIDVSIHSGETVESVKGRIDALIPEGYYVDTPSGRTRQVEITLARFRNSIGLIGFMALFVGMYLIYNAVSISVVQRQKEIGILRALGGTRAQVMTLFLGETLVISLIASLIGAGLGIVFAKLTVGIVARSVTDIYMKTSVTDLAFSWGSFIKDIGIGMTASIFAAAFPAAASTRIAPVSAIRTLPYSADGFLLSGKIKLAAILCFIASIAIFWLYKAADAGSAVRSSTTVFSSMALLLLGVSLITSSFLKQFISFAHYPLSRMGSGGLLAGLNLKKNISRNAVAAAAVFFSIALFVSSTNVIYSTQKSMHDYLDSVIASDILVSSGQSMVTGGSWNIPMPVDLWKEIEQIPGVLSADPFRKIYLSYNGKRTLVEMVDVPRWMEYCPFMIVEGNRDDIRRRAPGQDNIAVNEKFAAIYGIKPGDSFMLPTPNGPVRFGVLAIIVSYTTDTGIIWMDIHTYQRHWGDHLADLFQVRVKPGEDITTVREAILARFGKDRKLFVQPAGEFKDEVRKILDRSFAINNAVNIIALIIAAFGIVVTLLASVLERTREIGVLRSIGMTRMQVSAVVITESIILGAVGGLLGIITGTALGWLNLEGFFRLDFGASMNYHIHYPSILWAILLSMGISAIAGVYPARHAAKTNIVEALAYE